jgi:hypothetical protein
MSIQPTMAQDVYVATEGSDLNSGTATRPVATLEKARDLLRARQSKAGGAVVHVRSGIYLRTEPFLLSETDSGVEGGRITYRADGDGVRLVGGRMVPASAFRPVSDPAVKARLPEAARAHVIELDLAKLGLKNTGPFPDLFRDGGGIVELFMNGKRLPLARWPNEGYTTIKRVTDSGVWSGDNKRGGTFQYRDKRAAGWQKAVADGLWLKGFWRVPWQPETVRVAAIDPVAGTITQAQEVGGGLGAKTSKVVNGTRVGNGKEEWYALNLLEELDRPGEWCLHFPTKTLYLWPPEDAGSSPEIMIADMKEPMVIIKNAANITFQGFILEGGLGDGISVDGGSDVLIAGCEMRNLTGTGVVIDGGRKHRVVSCDIHHLGRGGIYVGGGDRKTLTPGSHEVLNNHIYRVGQLQTTYAPAIMLGTYGSDLAGSSLKAEAVGCRMAHNLIHDLPHAAVLYGGNDNVLEYNEVWRVAQDSYDVGAFYTWHDWTSRGNILRHNLVADSPGCNAFYMDDGDSGDTVTGNVIWRTDYGPFIGGGRDNVIKGNLVIDAGRGGLHIDDRGVARGYNQNSRHLMAGLKAVDYQSPRWSTRYPELVGILNDDPAYPKGNKLIGNVLIGSKVSQHGNAKHFKGSTISNNPVKSRQDANLPKTGNPIPTLRKREAITFPDVSGFEPIPIGKIGLYKDEFRKSLPAVE